MIDIGEGFEHGLSANLSLSRRVPVRLSGHYNPVVEGLEQTLCGSAETKKPCLNKSDKVFRYRLPVVS
jgi:hypothetical protein